MACYEAEHREGRITVIFRTAARSHTPQRKLTSKLPETCYGHVGKQNKGQQNGQNYHAWYQCQHCFTVHAFPAGNIQEQIASLRFSNCYCGKRKPFFNIQRITVLCRFFLLTPFPFSYITLQQYLAKHNGSTYQKEECCISPPIRHRTFSSISLISNRFSQSINKVKKNNNRLSKEKMQN